jgi:AcrR family transcriptional regulator
MTANESGEAPEPLSDAEAIASAAVRLAGRRGWRNLALADIAAEAGVSLGTLAGIYACRPDILDGFERMIDRRMLSRAAAEDTGDKPRDRLFDIIMERLEALHPYRDGVRRIARELPFDPISGLVLAAALPRSMAWMYEGARIPAEGPFMPAKLAALGGLYLSVLRVWLNDESQDLAKTMAALDRQLDRATALFTRQFGRRGQKATRPADGGGEAEPLDPEPPQAP